MLMQYKLRSAKVGIAVVSLAAIVGITVVFLYSPRSFAEEGDTHRATDSRKKYVELFGKEPSELSKTDPELASIRNRFIYSDVFHAGKLTDKQRELITIVSLATQQSLPQLKEHTRAALNIGVTPLEIREAVYTLAAFIGFPKTENAIAAANEVFTERKIALPLKDAATVEEKDRFAKGLAIQDPIYGNEIKEMLKALPGGLGEDVPRFLTELLFGDFYTRQGLDIKTRELLTLCSLVTLGAERQIKAHAIGNLKVGNDKETQIAAIVQCLPYIGFPYALNAINIIKGIDTGEPVTERKHCKLISETENVGKVQPIMSTTTTQSGTGPSTPMEITQPHTERRRLSPDDVRQVAPALERYTQERLYGEVWKRPDLSPRDRSIVTIAALIARGQTGALPYYFAQALDNGVKPSEISEIIVHLAYYSGWGNAFGAVGAAKEVFEQRGIGPDQLPAASGDLLPLDETAEAERAAQVEKNFGTVSPGVVQYTTDALFRDLWLRPGLAPRDRSLVTVSALVATGQVAQVTYHLNRAMDNGLTQAQASEALTQLAFYAGWPNVFSALPVVKDVFEKRLESGK